MNIKHTDNDFYADFASEIMQNVVDGQNYKSTGSPYANNNRIIIP